MELYDLFKNECSAIFIEVKVVQNYLEMFGPGEKKLFWQSKLNQLLQRSTEFKKIKKDEITPIKNLIDKIKVEISQHDQRIDHYNQEIDGINKKLRCEEKIIDELTDLKLQIVNYQEKVQDIDRTISTLTPDIFSKFKLALFEFIQSNNLAQEFKLIFDLLEFEQPFCNLSNQKVQLLEIKRIISGYNYHLIGNIDSDRLIENHDLLLEKKIKLEAEINISKQKLEQKIENLAHHQIMELLAEKLDYFKSLIDQKNEHTENLMGSRLNKENINELLTSKAQLNQEIILPEHNKKIKEITLNQLKDDIQKINNIFIPINHIQRIFPFLESKKAIKREIFLKFIRNLEEYLEDHIFSNLVLSNKIQEYQLDETEVIVFCKGKILEGENSELIRKIVGLY